MRLIQILSEPGSQGICERVPTQLVACLSLYTHTAYIYFFFSSTGKTIYSDVRSQFSTEALNIHIDDCVLNLLKRFISSQGEVYESCQTPKNYIFIMLINQVKRD